MSCCILFEFFSTNISLKVETSDDSKRSGAQQICRSWWDQRETFSISKIIWSTPTFHIFWKRRPPGVIFNKDSSHLRACIFRSTHEGRTESYSRLPSTKSVFCPAETFFWELSRFFSKKRFTKPSTTATKVSPCNRMSSVTSSKCKSYNKSAGIHVSYRKIQNNQSDAVLCKLPRCGGEVCNNSIFGHGFSPSETTCLYSTMFQLFPKKFAQVLAFENFSNTSPIIGILS
ncbi:hypothetical protein ACFE04_011147 [Oxalis oulophora]